MQLFGDSFDRGSLSPLIGRMDQVASIRRVTLEDGAAWPMRAAIVDAGNGFTFTVALDRCMDLVSASHCGRALGWRAKQGDVAPQHYDAAGLGWLRTFPGGLLATCGLGNVGSPQANDPFGRGGLHGRIGNTPAEAIGTRAFWDGDDYVLELRGSMREASTFGENFVLHRTLRCVAGSNRIELRDTLVNEGTATTPFQFLYHCNLGWPVLSPQSEFLAPSRAVRPRDAVAEPGVAAWTKSGPPTPGYAEQVFYHELAHDPEGWVTTALVNPALGAPASPFGVIVRYRANTLPWFAQWKQLGAQDYVMGLEPATCSVQGRAHDEAHGWLQHLEPGEAREFALEFEVVDRPEQVDALRTAIAG